MNGAVSCGLDSDDAVAGVNRAIAVEVDVQDYRGIGCWTRTSRVIGFIDRTVSIGVIPDEITNRASPPITKVGTALSTGICGQSHGRRMRRSDDAVQIIRRAHGRTERASVGTGIRAGDHTGGIEHDLVAASTQVAEGIGTIHVRGGSCDCGPHAGDEFLESDGNIGQSSLTSVQDTISVEVNPDMITDAPSPRWSGTKVGRAILLPSGESDRD